MTKPFEKAAEFIKNNSGKRLVVVSGEINLSYKVPEVSVKVNRGGLSINGKYNPKPYHLKQGLNNKTDVNDNLYIDAGASISTADIYGLHFEDFKVSVLAGRGASCYAYVLEEDKEAVEKLLTKAADKLTNWVNDLIVQQESFVKTLLLARGELLSIQQDFEVKNNKVNTGKTKALSESDFGIG